MFKRDTYPLGYYILTIIYLFFIYINKRVRLIFEHVQSVLFNSNVFTRLSPSSFRNFTNRCRTPCTPMRPREAATTGREDSHPILPTCCVYHSTNDGRYCNSLLRHLPAHSYTSLSCCKITKKF